MSEDDNAPTPELVRHFAGLVALAAHGSTSISALRDAARGVMDEAKKGTVSFEVVESGILANGRPCEAPELAAQLATAGVLELAITERASLADLLDLARLLALPRTDADPAARFAARAAVLDAKALPRRLRPRASQVLPVASAEVPAVQAVEERQREQQQDEQAEPERLEKALAPPIPSHPALAAAMEAIDLADGAQSLTAALAQLVQVADLAFRQGRDDDLIEAVTALVAIEHEWLERDSSDVRRQSFNFALRKLAKPVILRQLAILRHQRANDAVASERLQQVLYRYGVDGAEALIDEYVSAASPEARAICLESLRGLRRTADALHALARDPRDLVVRQAAGLLGELADESGEAILVELLHHPDSRTRRAAVRALDVLDGKSVREAIAIALSDESPLVRIRAVAALQKRADPPALDLLIPVLENEPDREVLVAAIGAVGAIGGAGSAPAVQRLIRIASGEGAHPLRKNAAIRIHACMALVALRTPTTMASVQVLRDDRDREVREASMRLVAQAQRRTTSGSIPIVAGS